MLFLSEIAWMCCKFKETLECFPSPSCVLSPGAPCFLPGAAVPVCAGLDCVMVGVVCSVLCPCFSSKAVSGSPQVIMQTVSYPNDHHEVPMLMCIPASFKVI